MARTLERWLVCVVSVGASCDKNGYGDEQHQQPRQRDPPKMTEAVRSKTTSRTRNTIPVSRSAMRASARPVTGGRRRTVRPVAEQAAVDRHGREGDPDGQERKPEHADMPTATGAGRRPQTDQRRNTAPVL